VTPGDANRRIILPRATACSGNLPNLPASAVVFRHNNRNEPIEYKGTPAGWQAFVRDEQSSIFRSLDVAVQANAIGDKEKRALHWEGEAAIEASLVCRRAD
jgi:hypothetical protein